MTKSGSLYWIFVFHDVDIYPVIGADLQANSEKIINP
jgi:hypothetical protein